MLNKKQVLELFEREAVCFGQEDGVPLFRVRQLFGEKTAKFASCSKNYNLFGTGEYNCGYLYLMGFMYTATYANIEELQTLEAQSGTN